jgi:hypothetical protein
MTILTEALSVLGPGVQFILSAKVRASAGHGEVLPPNQHRIERGELGIPAFR